MKCPKISITHLPVIPPFLRGLGGKKEKKYQSPPPVNPPSLRGAGGLNNK